MVVTTPSELTLATTRKTLQLLRRLGLPVLGLVENLVRDADVHDGGGGGVGPAGADGGRPRIVADGLLVLGRIGYDDSYEASLGEPDRLRGTAFFRDVHVIAGALGADRPAPGG